jgi:Uncharacterised nucleotidyltransferase
MQEIAKVLCTSLRNGSSPSSAGLAPADISRFLDTARLNGVLPLLASKLYGKNSVHEPEEILTACREEARNQAIYELAHRVEIIGVLEALDSAGISPLILKGTALAYNLYPNPALRPRCDTDLLIHPEWRRETDLTLKSLGYSQSEGGEGEHIFYEAAWSREDRLGVTHNLDIHWRISNSEILAKSLGYDELAERSVGIIALGAHARTLSPIHALLFACIHRAGHAHAPLYVDGIAYDAMNRLIWLYDIHLMISQMSIGDLGEFAALASAKRVREICRDALLRTRECFATEIPQPILESLNNSGSNEPSALFLSAGKARMMAENFRALKGWQARCGWIRQLVFPSAQYMLWKYPDATKTWLPVLYVRRAFNGILRSIMPVADRDKS